MIDTNLKKNFEEFYNRILPYLNGVGNNSSGSGGSGHTIQDNGTDMATQDALNLIGFDVTDNDTDGSTDVSMHELTNAELSEILPSNQNVPYMNGSYALVANRFEKGNMYDTQERIIGKWIDGKPIYQKTLYDLSFPHGNTSISVSALNIDRLISCKGNYLKYGNDYRVGILGTGFTFYMSDQNTLIVEADAGGASHSDVCLTIRYTKTTDTVVKVADANDYSTDETIIGTWIDGKPLYQKTISTGALPNATSKTVATNIANIKRVVNMFGYAFLSQRCITLPYPLKGYECNLDIRSITSSGANVMLNCAGNLSDFTESYVTLQYTKTTD